MDTLMAEYDRLKDQNPIYVHLMFIVLMETSAALAAVPYDSSDDGEEFEKNVHGWLAKLLLDGKTAVLFTNDQEAIAKAVKAFTKHHLARWRICDAMQVVIAANDQRRWALSSVAEFVIREIAKAMVVRVYDHGEVIFALAQYREGRRT
jgi:ribosomal protein L10